MKSELQRLVALDRERVLISHISGLLQWDQETQMPPGAVDERSEQIAFLEGLAHEKSVDPEIGRLLESLGSTETNPQGDPSLDSVARGFLRVLRRAYDQQVKLPSDLVADMARARSLGQAAWVRAREENDFAIFLPRLERVVELQRRMAACLDSSRRPYDVLVDLFEPGSDEQTLRRVFMALKEDLVSLLERIRSRPQVDDAFLHRPCPDSEQETICRYFMETMGYDLNRGRLDRTAHPFTTTVGRADVRITTRYVIDDFMSSIFSVIHEGGHALYEQAIDPSAEYAGTCLYDAPSAGIHESQSRLWENVIGRSPAFWSREYPALKAVLGEVLSGVSEDAFVRAINKVEPSPIRTEADEVTYGLHIILRFEMESDLMSGRLAVRDVPEAWNAKTNELLGFTPQDDARGCLQDVHWAEGLFGYFPSYALGNLYAAQFVRALRGGVPDLDDRLKTGDYASARLWFAANIHAPGALYLPGELCERVTGEELNPRYFTEYLERKYSEIYGL